MATIKDIAEKAGLSIGTVSRIFNNRGYISAEAKEKVEKAMKELNYQPNALARSLSKSSSDVIGVIVPLLSHPFFSSLVRYIEDAASRNGQTIMLVKTDGEEIKENMMIAKCREYRVGGIILCSGRFSHHDLEKHEFPLVTIERFPENADFGIFCDNYKGGLLATEHLIKKGCKHLINLSGITGNKMPADERGEAFIKTAEEHGVSYKSFPYTKDLYASMDYKEFIEKVLLENPETDGVFASSDIIAAQVIQVCGKLKKKIPEDIKIVGFDDTIIASCTNPEITTIHQPIKEMAEIAVSTLLGIKQGQKTRGTATLDVYLVERQTT